MEMFEVVMENIAGRNRAKVYDLLINSVDSGPFDGGCVVIAQAIQQRYGGQIVVLTGYPQRNTDEVALHAAVQLGNTLIDFDGPASVNDFVRRFTKNELQAVGGKVTGIRAMQPSDLPDAPRAPALSTKIAKLLR